MRNRHVFSFLIFLIIISVGSTTGFSQNKSATAEQEVKAKRILNKLTSLIADESVDFTFSKLDYDKSENKYTFLNLRPVGEAEDKVENRFEIQNFSENSDKDEFKIGWMSIRVKDVNPPKHTRKTPPEFAFIFSDIEGSFPKHTLEIDKTEMVILAGESRKKQDMSGVSFIVDDFKIESLNKIRDFGAVFGLLKGEAPKDYFKKNPPEKLFETLIGYVSFDRLTVNGFPEQLEPNGKVIKLRNMQVNNLENGLIDNIEINDLSGKNPNDPKFTEIRMKRVSVEKIDLNKILKVAAKKKYRGYRTRKQPPSIEDIEDILRLAQGFSMKGVAMTGPSGYVAIKHFDFNWNNFVGPFPTEINLSGDISLRPDELEEKNAKFLEMLDALGVDVMNMKFDIRLEWDEDKNALVIKPFIYDLDKLFVVDFSAKVTNISKAMMLEKDPQKMLVYAMGANVGDITLRLTDKGVLRLLDDNARMRWDLMKEQFALDPNLAPIIEDLNRFLENPDGTFEATMKPRGPVNFVQLVAMGKLGPQVIFSLFDIQTSYLGKSNL